MMSIEQTITTGRCYNNS